MPLIILFQCNGNPWSLAFMGRILKCYVNLLGYVKVFLPGTVSPTAGYQRHNNLLIACEAQQQSN